MVRYAIALITFATLSLNLTVCGQNEFPGQPVQEDFQLSFWNVNTYGKVGYWELLDPSHPDAFAGIYDPNGTNAPSPKIVTVDGILGYRIPANQPYIVGITMAQALYDNSTGDKWQNFGKHFDHGDKLQTAINGAQWRTYNENQFVNTLPQDMWQMVSGDPMVLGNWAGAFAGLPPFMGEMPWGFAAPLGAGRFFNQIKPVIAALPPNVGPGGGNLIGMNVVVQLGVLDTNGSTPVAPKFTLTNALGIQAMAGPPIKLNAGAGGNWGPPLSDVEFRVENPNNSIRIDVPMLDGTIQSMPARVVDGNTVSFTIPRGAMTGAVEVKSSTGRVPSLRQPLVIVTHEDVQDLSIVGIPQFTSKFEVGGTRVFGASLVGTLNQIASKIVNIPVPSDMNLYDLEVEVYPLDRSSTYAGLGLAVPVDLAVAPAGTVPAAGPYTPSLGFAPDSVVLEKRYQNLSGPVDLSLSTNNGSTYDYLAIIRAVEK